MTTLDVPRAEVVRVTNLSRWLNYVVGAWGVLLMPFVPFVYPPWSQKLPIMAMDIGIVIHSVRWARAGVVIGGDSLLLRGVWFSGTLPFNEIEEIGVRTWSFTRSVAFIRMRDGRQYDCSAISGLQWKRRDNPKVLKSVERLREAVGHSGS